MELSRLIFLFRSYRLSLRRSNKASSSESSSHGSRSSSIASPQRLQNVGAMPFCFKLALCKVACKVAVNTMSALLRPVSASPSGPWKSQYFNDNRLSSEQTLRQESQDANNTVTTWRWQCLTDTST